MRLPPGHGVLWLDPGKTTGWAWLMPGNGLTDDFQSGQGDFLETGMLVRQMLEEGSVRALGWERFDITAVTYQMKGSSWALETIGMLRWISAQYDTIVLSPAYRDARNTVPPDLLRALGMHRPGQVHANDAARHLAAWCLRSGNMSKDMAGPYMRWAEGKILDHGGHQRRSPGAHPGRDHVL